MTTMKLNDFPGIPALVSECIDGTCRIPFGFQTTPDIDAWKRQSRLEAERDRPRDLIVDRMIAPAGNHLTEAVKQNLEALRDPSTLTVVTGQQVGLGGGPLLTLYKALTTVALARKMEKDSGVRTVPIFWMATSDHNLPEASQVYWIDLKNRLAGYKSVQQDNRIPVGIIKLNSIADELVSDIEQDLPDSEFKKDVLDALRESYTPDSTFADAFRSLAYRLLGETGLVMFDPEDIEVKRASCPFWEVALSNVDSLLDAIITRSDEIRNADYPLQALVESGRPAIYLHEDGVRRKIVLEGKQIRARSDIILARDVLQRIARENPESLSAGVTIRPMLQGWLLPTAAYVAGPHEMAYWAQLNTAFDILNIPKPAVVPRASITLIENKIRRGLEKFDLQPADFFGDIENLKERLITDHRDLKADEVFQTVDSHLVKAEKALLDMAREPEFNGLDQPISTAFRKINFHVEKLREKVRDRLHSQHGDTIAQIEKLSTHLFPANEPQERVITPIYFFVRYGTKLLRGLSAHILDAVGRHAFLDLEEMIDES
ncbi:MAG: bacillithiol biosynthesis cysteine-adding enzyme BshC [bacterium]